MVVRLAPQPYVGGKFGFLKAFLLVLPLSSLLLLERHVERRPKLANLQSEVCAERKEKRLL